MSELHFTIESKSDEFRELVEALAHTLGEWENIDNVKRMGNEKFKVSYEGIHSGLGMGHGRTMASHGFVLDGYDETDINKYYAVYHPMNTDEAPSMEASQKAVDERLEAIHKHFNDA